MKIGILFFSVVFLFTSCKGQLKKQDKPLDKKFDSILTGLDKKNNLNYKVSLDSNYNEIGTKIYYSDSMKIHKVIDFENSKINGTYVRLGEDEYPNLITILNNDKLNFFIKFYPNGRVKNITSNNKKGRVGISLNYYESGKLKNKYELLDGKINGYKFEYNQKGKLIKKTKYFKGEITR